MHISKIDKIIEQVAAGKFDSKNAALQILKASRKDASNEIVFQYDEPYLRDHTVRGTQVLMGVTFLGIMIDFLIKDKELGFDIEIHHVLFKKLIQLEKGERVKLSIQSNSNSLEISREDGTELQSIAEAEIPFKKRSSHNPSRVTELDQINFKPTSRLYTALAETEIVHGKTLQTLSQYAVVEDEVFGLLELDPSLLSDRSYYIHPTFFDGALVAATALVRSAKLEDPFVPFSVKKMKIYTSINPSEKAYCKCRLIKSNSEIFIFQVELFNNEFKKFAELNEVICKRIHKEKTIKQENTGLLENTPSSTQLNNIEGGLSEQALRYIEELLKSTSDLKTISLDTNFINQGIESMQLIELAEVIEKDLGIKLYPTILFEYPDPQSFAIYLVEDFSTELSQFFNQKVTKAEAIKELKVAAFNIEDQPKKIKEELDVSEKITLTTELIKETERNPKRYAIIGMSGRFPGGTSITSFWNRIKNNESLVTEVPSDRWDWKDYYSEGKHIPNHTVCKWGGFLKEVTYFDNKFFGISEEEAKMMDPQLRQLLEVVYECAEDSGQITSLKGSNTGVFTGACFHDYCDVMNRRNVAPNQYSGTGNAATILSNQVSNFLDLRGASLTVDTACSSSLFALNSAIQNIASGDCDMAFVNGVNLLFSPEHYIYFSSKGFLSPIGVTDSFGKNANGYVPSEAVVSFLIKPLEQAIEDGDRIHAEICSIALGHAGKTNSVTTPSTRQQAEVMRKAWNKANVSPSKIAYIEGHGTGTSFGDAIELEAIKMASRLQFRGYLGSVKSNIGHSEGASGLVSIVKVVMTMKDKKLPAMPGFQEVNTIANDSSLSFRINKETVPVFNKKSKEYGAVSSFGFGGSYAHVVLAPSVHYHTKEKKEDYPKQCYLVPISAKTIISLRYQLEKLVNFLEKDSNRSLRLEDISYTLFSSRETFQQKVLIIARDTNELVEKVNELLFLNKTDKYDIGGIHHGNYDIAQSLMDQANLWIGSNYLIQKDWVKLFEMKGLKIDLPFYAFDKRPFWFDEIVNQVYSTEETRTRQPLRKEDNLLKKIVDANSLKNTVNQIISRITKVDEEFLDEDIELADFAIDSSQLHAISHEISENLNIIINPTLFFQLRTYGELLSHLINLRPNINHSVQVESKVTKTINDPKQKFKSKPESHDDVAIIGMNGIFPGGSNIDEFWEVLVSGKSTFKTTPTRRKEELQTLAKSWDAGFIDNVDQFDYDFFKISKREACSMDPQQRLFLQSAWKTLEDAGVDMRLSKEHSMGVFVGVSTSDYLSLLEHSNVDVEVAISTGNAHCSIPNRVSYLLNLNGPSEAVDTACSSSLVAMQRAVLSIRNGDCETALVGGVNLNFSDGIFELFSKAGMLSPTGICRPFSEEADGYIRGEGIASVLLKPLDKAVLDKDQIYAVIKAVGVNHGGKANTYTSPNSKRQAELVAKTLTNAKVDVNSIQFIEAHATATKLGDPVEVNGLKEAFQQKGIESSKNHSNCYLGSVKGNIGHLESAAGIAGLIKSVLAMNKKIIPPNPHAQQLNKLLELEQSHFVVNTDPIPWEKNGNVPRRSSVSSFGFGGANAYLVLEDYNKPEETFKIISSKKLIFILSAKTSESLHMYCQEYIDFLESKLKKMEKINLDQLIYNVQCRRTHFDYRLAMVVNSVDDILIGLKKVCNIDTTRTIKIYKGEEKTKNRDKSYTDLHEQELAKAWANHEVFVDWKQFNQGVILPVMKLPTYPFMKTTAWYTDLLPAEKKKKLTTTAEQKYSIRSHDWMYQFKWKREEKISKNRFYEKSSMFIEMSGDKELHYLLKNHYKDTFVLSSELLNTNLTSLIRLNEIETVIILDENIIEKNGYSRSFDFEKFKSLLERISDINKKLQCIYVTQGLQEMNGYEHSISFEASLPLGLIKTWGNEMSHISVQCIDVLSTSTKIENIIHQVSESLEEFFNLRKMKISSGEFAYRNKTLYSKRIVNWLGFKKHQSVLKKHGTYILIGGTGGIGSALADYLSDVYKSNIILVGRREFDTKIEKQIQQIRDKGVSGQYIQSDVIDWKSIERNLLPVLKDSLEIEGVFYLAMNNEALPLASITKEGFERVTSSKVIGLKNIARLLEQVPTQFLTVFSSSICLFNNSGLSSYAAACRFQDAFCQDLEQKVNYKVRVINWGYWGEVGTVANKIFEDSMQKRGTYPIYTLEGFEAMEQMIASDNVQTLGFKVDEVILNELKLILQDDSDSIGILEELDLEISTFLN